MTRPIRVTDLREKKQRGEKIAMLTAYDTTMARLFDEVGVDALLVGDSVGNVVLGYNTTIPVTLDAMVHHTRAVSQGAVRSLVVADMPFLTYQVSVPEAVRNAGRLLQEGGAAAVKLEGGGAILEVVTRLVDIGIPVLGHLGLQPQSVHQVGGFRRQGTRPAEADTLIADAVALERAGACAIVLESIPSELAGTISRRLEIPTIGIGAGPDCDGQVLVSYDMLGLSQGHVPPFVKRYANLGGEIATAAKAYVEDVQAGRFPETRTTTSIVPGG